MSPYRETVIPPKERPVMRWKFRGDSIDVWIAVLAYVLGWCGWSIPFIANGLADPRVRRSLIVAVVATVVGLLLGTERVPREGP